MEFLSGLKKLIPNWLSSKKEEPNVVPAFEPPKFEAPVFEPPKPSVFDPLSARTPSSRAGLFLLKKFEGLRLEAYQDIVGVWTIGYGETLGVKKGMKITPAEAEQMLLRRYDEFEEGVLALVKRPLTQNELGALTSLAYNIGLHNFKTSTLLKKLNANDPTAVDQFPRWNMAGNKVVRGLTIRRREEAVLFSTPDSNV